MFLFIFFVIKLLIAISNGFINEFYKTKIKLIIFTINKVL